MAHCRIWWKDVEGEIIVVYKNHSRVQKISGGHADMLASSSFWLIISYIPHFTKQTTAQSANWTAERGTRQPFQWEMSFFFFSLSLSSLSLSRSLAILSNETAKGECAYMTV